MLQRPVHVQDENLGAHAARPAQDAENSFPGVGRATSKGLGSGKAVGLSSHRKALQNITNTGKAGDARPAGKGTPLAPRKTLGDITNATPRLTQPASAAQKAVLPQAQTQKAAAEVLAEIYAEDGVERLAGKGWRELEKEQQLRDDADIAARVAAINAVPFRIPFATSSVRGRRSKPPLQPIAAQQEVAEVPRPPSPPPTPHCFLDLDELASADALLLEGPKIDWSFGSMITIDAPAAAPDPGLSTAAADVAD